MTIIRFDEKIENNVGNVFLLTERLHKSPRNEDIIVYEIRNPEGKEYARPEGTVVKWTDKKNQTTSKKMILRKQDPYESWAFMIRHDEYSG